MSDLGFVAAAYLVILGGMAAYAVLLIRRIGRAGDPPRVDEPSPPAPE